MNTRDVVELAEVRQLARSGAAKRIRLNANLAVTDVARAVGVAPSTTWRWEEGQRTPTGAAALRWKRLLDRLAAQREDP
jgi:DNA-binding transcriptional regulator YiaG